MANESILKVKSFNFAVRVVKLYTYLKANEKEYVLSKQVLRSGTSIGASIREAEFAESTNDFIHKFHIALKEANETVYWLQLLKSTGHLSEAMFSSINYDALELIKLLVTSIKSLKSKVANRKRF